MPKLHIAPSILSANFGDLNADIKTIERFSDMIHVDIMDGHFVPNLTIGAPVVAHLKSRVPLECHLMIEHPEKYIDDFAKAGAWMITVHAEACPRNLKKVLQMIRRKGVRAAVALNPTTPLSRIMSVLNVVDMVLLMTVWPGFGGQTFIGSVVPKMKKLRQLRPNLDIQVDGGINEKTARVAKEAGANILVAGSYIFDAKNRRKAIETLRNA